MQPEEFAKRFDVSRETLAKLEAYHALLLKWQKAINLVSPKTIPEAWARHFADSAQLVKFIPADTKTLVDLGSGAGFPGLVLGILRPDIEVHLVESDERKAQFLRTVSRETEAGIIVHNARIEAVAPDLSPDLVTARALAALPDLLGFCLPWAEANESLQMLFLKGEKADEELEKARQDYDFACESFPSEMDGRGSILHIQHLKTSCA